MMAINHVVPTGKSAKPGPNLTYNAASAKPACRLTLIAGDRTGGTLSSPARRGS